MADVKWCQGYGPREGWCSMDPSDCSCKFAHQQYQRGREDGAREREAQIVAWLRGSGQNSYAAHHAFPSFHVISHFTGERIDCNTPVDLDHLAAALERGEDQKETTR